MLRLEKLHVIFQYEFTAPLQSDSQLSTLTWKEA